MQPRLLREPVRLAGLPLLRLQADDRLVRLVRDGHGPAFTVLVDRYRSALMAYCTRLVGAQRAEDAVQQTFVNAHRALTERLDEGDVELRPWLYRIAHNASLNLLRGEAAGYSLDDPDGPPTALASPPDDVEIAVERRARLDRTLAAISALPAAQRDALVLREFEGRSHVEIAGALGVSAGAARQHLMRARAAVRAAATAVTPYPLVSRLSGWMGGVP
ncbi:MAG: polymerase, sigma-24 subunit, subfamily, partial [Solirubrobacterales bacterium]|nr:polymerase, sigma-24 subunit, subfamily [Solirubrobacterales bacterium]